MSHDSGADAHSRRPKKLIFAPGDIQDTPDSLDPSVQPQSAVPSHLNPAEALRSNASTPDSATENQLMSHPARAHQFVTNPPLTISQMHGTNPLHQFNSWFHDPRLAPSSSPETCTLATAELPSGRVSARILYLKELDERGWVVYSNWGSREGKGRQVWGAGDNTGTIGCIPAPGETTQGNKWGALTFLWASVERQVRIEGMLEPLSREESELYWQTRERGSQIGAWASWQSQELWSGEPSQLAENQRRKSVAKLQGEVPADIDETDIDDGRALLEQRVKDMEQRFAGVEKIPLPPFWGGVRLVPESVEFWQGRKSRLHDRFRDRQYLIGSWHLNLPGRPIASYLSASYIYPTASFFQPPVSYITMALQPAQKPTTSPWIILAVASGAFAALNGVFAKLTTDNNTTSFAQSIAHLFGLDSSPFLELLVRGACLGLNVVCNIIMWALFTRALTAGPSTVKVSITNTASNFLATALLGMVVFREAVGGALVAWSSYDGSRLHFGWDARGGIDSQDLVF
ncbi:FMN-binding split barrel-related protein [Penicillium maclennaniae]|uniref:FMN-binding split barrel-related protein n=1 Tax=Penicillium maclennaniae TaxID=1343394 RepID=UPI0025412B35|nr:FMN-binding split barrel-related protein [Penicillium maclennaniae]KAJ5677787.1 FMN-binding split barrel-related protein [Penicillium maclennaniae]